MCRQVYTNFGTRPEPLVLVGLCLGDGLRIIMWSKLDWLGHFDFCGKTGILKELTTRLLCKSRMISEYGGPSVTRTRDLPIMSFTVLSLMLFFGN